MPGKMPVKVSGKIIELIKNNQLITIPELAVIIDLSERTIERYMKQLQEEGIIRRVGTKKGGLWEVIE
jgi:ATP-dependent DNA helicase RecG